MLQLPLPKSFIGTLNPAQVEKSGAYIIRALSEVDLLPFFTVREQAPSLYPTSFVETVTAELLDWVAVSVMLFGLVVAAVMSCWLLVELSTDLLADCSVKAFLLAASVWDSRCCWAVIVRLVV